MTRQILKDYYDKHKHIYHELSNNCGSVPALLLKIEIYGKKWTSWDWALFFAVLTKPASFFAYNNVEQCQSKIDLIKDVFDAIDNTNALDKILTNKQVLLSIIYVASNAASETPGIGIQYNINSYVCRILAHIFKKWPRLWNISWMQARYYDSTKKKWLKHHRLSWSTLPKYKYSNAHSSHYYSSQTFFDDFQQLYYNMQ